MSRLARAGLMVAAALLTLFPSTAGASEADPAGNLGTNLAGITYYDGAMIFTDLVRQASDWIPQQEGKPWGQGPALSLDRDGWPTRFSDGQFASLVLADVTYPAGDYSVSWRGSGSFTIAGRRFSGRDGQGSVALDGQSTVVLDLRSTQPSDPLREIEVRVPGATDGAQFTQDYLRQLAPYRVVRFMDWQRTNSTFADPPRRFTCDTRITADHYSQGTSMGASVETMVDLANASGTHPWFTIPHEASLEWVRCHTRVVAQRLNPGLVPRYEFSNETWNSAFRAFHDLTDEATALGLGAGDSFLGLQHLVARRHNAAMGVIGEEMTKAGRPYRRVLSGQAANAWVIEQRLAEPGTVARTDELAIAPYLGVAGNAFDPAQAHIIAQWTPQQVVSHLEQQQVAKVESWIADHVSLSRRTDIPLVAYEAGQHLAGDPNNDQLTALFTEINRSEAIGPLYRTYLSRWRDLTGNALLMHFTDTGPYSRYGSWGAFEAGTDPASSPKYHALTEFSGLPEPAVPPPASTPPASPPPGSPPVTDPQPGIRLAAGARFTRQRIVDVDVHWPADATEVRLANDASMAGSTRFRPGQRVRWRLPERRRGTVFARFDTTGDRTFSDSILLDQTPAEVIKVQARRIGAQGIQVVSTVRDRVSGLAAAQVCLRRGCAPITFGEHPRRVAVVTGSPTPHVYVRFVDGAGNRTAWHRAPVR